MASFTYTLPYDCNIPVNIPVKETGQVSDLLTS